MKAARANGFGIIEIILLVAVIGLAAAIGWELYDAHLKTGTAVKTPGAAQTAASSTPLATGSSDQDLQGDLKTVNSDLSQSGSDMNTANSAVNDSQSQISVPTN